MSKTRPTIIVEEGCLRVLTWLCGEYAISVGIYESKCGEHEGYFLHYDETVDMHLREDSPANILYEHIALWAAIQAVLYKQGVRLVTTPPANAIGPPADMLF